MRLVAFAVPFLSLCHIGLFFLLWAGMRTSIRCARRFTVADLQNLRHNPFLTDPPVLL